MHCQVITASLSWAEFAKDLFTGVGSKMSSPAVSSDAQEGDISLQTPDVLTRQREEAGTANDLVCEQDLEERRLAISRMPRPAPRKELDIQEQVCTIVCKQIDLHLWDLQFDHFCGSRESPPLWTH